MHTCIRSTWNTCSFFRSFFISLLWFKSRFFYCVYIFIVRPSDDWCRIRTLFCFRLLVGAKSWINLCSNSNVEQASLLPDTNVYIFVQFECASVWLTAVPPCFKNWKLKKIKKKWDHQESIDYTLLRPYIHTQTK